MNNNETFALLRSMDAAPPATAIDTIRASQLREDILRTPRHGAHPERKHGLFHGTRQKIAGVTAFSGAAAATVIAAFTISSGASAYADWTAAPQVLSSHDAQVAATACASKLSDLDTVPQPGEPTGRPPLTLSERRGEYVLLEYATKGLTKEETCLATLKEDSAETSQVDVAGGGGGASTARAHTIDVANEVTMGDPQLTLVTGAAGKDVRAVTVHSQGRSIQASVRNGVFTAIWPGSYAKRKGKTLVRTTTYDVTLNNGTVLKNAPAVG